MFGKSLFAALAVLMAAVTMIAGVQTADAADYKQRALKQTYQSKYVLRCPPKIVQACKKTERNVCTLTDNKGCCIRVECQPR